MAAKQHPIIAGFNKIFVEFYTDIGFIFSIRKDTGKIEVVLVFPIRVGFKIDNIINKAIG